MSEMLLVNLVNMLHLNSVYIKIISNFTARLYNNMKVVII